MKRSVRNKPLTNRKGKEDGQDSQIRSETLSSSESGIPAPEEVWEHSSHCNQQGVEGNWCGDCGEGNEMRNIKDKGGQQWVGIQQREDGRERNPPFT